MDYEQLKIEKFDLWDLYLHGNQYPYVGRCYAAAIREDAELLTDMTAAETAELFGIVIPKWRAAVAAVIGNFRPNMAIFGNEWPHLHAHLIPRFSEPKNLYDMEFEDPNPKGNYAPYPKKKLPMDLLLQIKADIQAVL